MKRLLLGITIITSLNSFADHIDFKGPDNRWAPGVIFTEPFEKNLAGHRFEEDDYFMSYDVLDEILDRLPLETQAKLHKLSDTYGHCFSKAKDTIEKTIMTDLSNAIGKENDCHSDGNKYIIQCLIAISEMRDPLDKACPAERSKLNDLFDKLNFSDTSRNRYFMNY